MAFTCQSLCQALYHDWFQNPNVWFTSTLLDDERITNTWYPFTKELSDSSDLSTWDNREIIGLVILLDQVPRHANRVIRNVDIESYTQRAVRVSKQLLKMISTNELTLEELCFVLLPLRHTKRVTEIRFVLDTILSLENKVTKETSKSLFRRFLRATYKDLLFANNRIQCHVVSNPSRTHPNDVVEVMESGNLDFYDNQMRISIPPSWKHDLRSVITHEGSPVIISLSGGVDSMVLAVVMKHLGYSLRAVHIDYQNRATSEKEARFVQQVCKHLDIPCYIRSFHELQRNSTHRDLYEEVTKMARFDYYRCVGDHPVVLGHHKDDCFENIITNVCASKKWDNLTGMDLRSECLGITVIRPFLNIHKEDILHFAKKYRIPYLIDTTLSQSTRGRLRRQLVPSLQQYDPNLIHGLYTMSNTMEDLFLVMKSVCDKVLQQKMMHSETHIELMVPVHLPLVAWRHICLELSIRDVSHKSLENLIWKIQRDSRQVYKHPLNRVWMAQWRFQKDSSAFYEFHFFRM